MSNLVRRENTLYSASVSRVVAAPSLSVVAYEVGAQVALASPGTTATVRRGHGFVTGDKFIVFRSGSYVANSYNQVTGATSTTLTISAASLAVGDLLVNLGADTGSSAPNYDMSGVSIYSDMAGAGAAIPASTVTTNAQGVYGYWHRGDVGIWELVLSSGTPTALVIVSESISPASTLLPRSQINVRDFGARGDNSTDDSAAIAAAIAALPTNLGYGAHGGGVIYFPPGVYVVNSPVEANHIGVVFRGDSAFSSVIKAGSSFSGGYVVRFKKQTGTVLNKSVGIHDMTIDVNDKAAHGVQVLKAYDHVNFSNVSVENVGEGGNAFRFEPDPDEANSVSQTILVENCSGYRGASSDTSSVWYLKNLQEANFIGCKGFGRDIAGGSDSAGVPWDIIDCRTLNLIGCSAAFTTSEGVKVTTVNQSSVGVNILGCLFESCTTKATFTGQSGKTIQRAVLRDSRDQNTVGSVTLQYTDLCQIECDNNITVGANSDQTHIICQLYSRITDNGTNTTIVTWGNAVDADMRINRGLRINGDVKPKRFRPDQGTAHVSGDYALSAGWGTTASLSLVGAGEAARDSRGRFSVTSAGTGQGANPTITMTFKDGTWTSAPFAIVARCGGDQMTVPLTWTTTATTLVITFAGTPVAGEAYQFSFVTAG